MRIAIAATAFSLTLSSAWAGCSNYTDGSLATPAPRVSMCIDGACEDTTVDFECGNATGAQIGYANGLRIEYSEGAAPVVYRVHVYAPKEIAKMTCEPAENCAGFPLSQP